MAQESRQLSAAEFSLRKQLKLKVLGLAAIERARKRQASRIGWLCTGDANTKLFHAKMKSRGRNFFIHSLRVGDREISDHAEKEKSVHDHFVAVLGEREQRRKTLNWDTLNVPVVDQQGLDSPFSMVEVWATIIASPTEKAPGPDGFTGQFLGPVGQSSRMRSWLCFTSSINLLDKFFQRSTPRSSPFCQRRTELLNLATSDPSA